MSLRSIEIRRLHWDWGERGSLKAVEPIEVSDVHTRGEGVRSGNIQTSYLLATMLLMLAPSRERPPISSHPITYNPPALGNNRYPIAILLKLILYFILK